MDLRAKQQEDWSVEFGDKDEWQGAANEKIKLLTEQIFQADAGTSNAAITASEMSLVAIIEGASTSSLTAADFLII
jgi:hypothetical protein